MSTVILSPTSFAIRAFVSVLILTPLFSESCFDASLPENFSFFVPVVDIAKWSEDVSGSTNSAPDFLFSSSNLDMNSSAEAFELKHDTVSVYSMDSAYQSQSGASRRGPMMQETYSSLNPQETRSRVNSQFLGSDIYSPTLSSDNYSAFPEHHHDMSQVQLPSAVGETETGENSFAYNTNYTTGQDYSQFTATSMSRFAPTSGMDMGYQWPTADTQSFNAPYTMATFPKSTHSLDTSLYSNQDAPDLMFNAPAPLQRQLSRPRVDTTIRPTAVRNSSSFSATQEGSRRQSTGLVAPFVMSPASAVSVHVPSITTGDFDHQQLLDARAEKEETASNSLAAQSADDDEEPLSPSDAAEAKNMEEEQGKVARSHPLYQAQPDESGKYHCPNEGKAGCNHKPTPLKCNYDKYVDSHLKPFRCNKKVCVGVQFSSTACLLRHEREAHGMHGHGSRPHLCHFPDCERSVMGNGFPRRYNLFDHMKRVHDYTGPTTEPSPPSQQGQAGANRRNTVRKRKSTADDLGERRHKVSKPSPQQQLQQRRGQLQEAFASKKQNIIDILMKLSVPNDLGDDIQLTKEVMKLHEISAEFKKNLGG